MNSFSIYFAFIQLLLIYIRNTQMLERTRKFEIQHTLLRFGRDYSVRDINGNSNYKIVYKWLHSLGKTLKIEENHKVLYEIKHVVGRLYAEWQIYQNETLISQLKHEPSIFDVIYKVKSVNGNYRIQGNFLLHNFNIRKRRVKVAKIHKNHVHSSDTYGIDINSKEDPAFIIALCIIIDVIRHHYSDM
ncbi:unnamed protein product [Didymodactylos carnosus]|uniref:Uncharacterized protein n=1 Tax=Didymodactylos carnosus TaxID=1234261 RepID=A0A813ZTA8_9BILA|nr:unnamed protein product [Didymodactylos carnosus]CAF0999035.1 unnamed protein product [Didymodactylos carnosus]CAF3685167.1 unnamed protein product [Didymodactylos carnosus]CAF3768561.1 unnamed protein product [Didymodactylos carnosus]